MLPLGFLLTQYTITGFDACAHLSEETSAASTAAARGIWQSIFYSAIGGWILLLAFLFAATDVDAVNEQAGFVGAIFETALTNRWAGAVFFISTVGQFFCTMSCMTSCSRMVFAFSRDGAIPGARIWRKVDAKRVPRNAVLYSGVIAVLLTLPALYKSPSGAPTAFYAVVSIGVIGLYVAFAIPIWQRLRMGDSFRPGPWTLGAKYKWMCWVSVIEIAHHLDLLHPAHHPCGLAGQRGVHLDCGQLRAAGDRWRAPRHHDLVGGLGQALVHGPEAHHRRGRAQGFRRVSR